MGGGFLIERKGTSQSSFHLYLYWFACGQIFLALLNLQTLKKIYIKKKPNKPKHHTHTYSVGTASLTYSFQLEASMNGTTKNQRGKLTG
jgi:hypothetical protein